MTDYVVIWNGGELLPARPEATAPMWRGGLSEAEAKLYAAFSKANHRHHLGVVRTGRYCACGCGIEMVYSKNTPPENYKTLRKGHAYRGAVARRVQKPTA